MCMTRSRWHGRSESGSQRRSPEVRSISRWLAWTPLMMVAALLYWTVALGLGCFSLMAVTALSGSSELVVEPTAEDTAVPVSPEADDPGPIMVHLQESVEPEDVNDNVGSGSSSVAADPAAVAAPAPGDTSY